MERLTTRHNGVAVIRDKSKLKEAMEKLAGYEEAEEQGLLLKLPCKVGDVVYCEEKCNVHKGIQAFQITNILISQNKKGKWTKKYRAMLLLNGKTIDWQLNFDFEELGKTVFLTKAEAEKALAEMENGVTSSNDGVEMEK